MLVAPWCNLLNVASHNHNIKSLTDAFVAMAVAEAQASLQVLCCFIVMMRDCDQHNQFYCRHFGTIAIIEGCGPVVLCGKGLVVALWQEANCCLAQCMHPIALVVRSSLSYPAQLPFLARGLLSPSLARGSLWPSSTNVASLVYLPYLPLAMYTPFLVYAHLILGKVAVLNLGVFTLMVPVWHDI